MIPELLERLPPELQKTYASFEQSRFAAFGRESLARLALVPFLDGAVGRTRGVRRRPRIVPSARREGKALRPRAEKRHGDNAAETARTFAVLWPRLNPKLRSGFYSTFEEAARAMPDREEGLTLLISAAFDGQAPAAICSSRFCRLTTPKRRRAS